MSTPCRTRCSHWTTWKSAATGTGICSPSPKSGDPVPRGGGGGGGGRRRWGRRAARARGSARASPRAFPRAGAEEDRGPPARPALPPSTPRIVPGPAGGRRSRAKGQRAVGAPRCEAGRKAAPGACRRSRWHVGRAARPGCLCVPAPPGRAGQGVLREEEAGQLCRGEVACPPFSSPRSPPHLGMAARGAAPTCAPSTAATLAGCRSPRLHPARRCVSAAPPSHRVPRPSRARRTPEPPLPRTPRVPIASSRRRGSARGDLLLRRPLPGATWGPTSASRLSAADVAPAGCWLRAAGSASCVSTGAGDGTGWGSPRPHVPAPRSALLLRLRQRLLRCAQPLLVPRRRAGRHLPR